MTMRNIGVGACVVLIVCGAGLHGAITQRWSVFAPNEARTQQLHAVTVMLPDANVQEVPHDVPLKERSIATTRRYDFANTRNMTIMTSIISGVPGAVTRRVGIACSRRRSV
jgi:hypothetical protein